MASLLKSYTRHKTFISYQHADEDEVSDFINTFVVTRRTIAAIALAALLPLSGCAMDEDTEAELVQAVRTGEIVFLVRPPVEGGEQGASEAGFEGRVVVDVDSGCVVGEGDGSVTGLVFPNGSRFDLDSSEVRMPGESTVPLETRVTLGGAYVDAQDLAIVAEAGCEHDEYFLVSSVAH